MFQINFVLHDAEQVRKQSGGIIFETGQWFHAGWTYHSGTATFYKNGCLYLEMSTWMHDDNPTPINQGIRLGSKKDNNIDLQLDEMYFWEVKKPARVFTSLYSKSV